MSEPKEKVSLKLFEISTDGTIRYAVNGKMQDVHLMELLEEHEKNKGLVAELQVLEKTAKTNRDKERNRSYNKGYFVGLATAYNTLSLLLGVKEQEKGKTEP